MAKRTFGCSSIINAVNLQFELAGHNLYTDIKRAKGGLWLCEHAIKRAVGYCDCNQGRLPCTCGKGNTVTPFRKKWMQQAPSCLHDAQSPTGLTWSS